MSRRYDITQKALSLREKFPALNEMTECIVEKCDFAPPYPVEDVFLWTIYGLISHLNDYHKWSRKDIADWLDTLNFDLTFPIPNKEVTHEHGNQDTPG